MKAIVNKTVCPLYRKPSRESTRVDEVLYGMVVEVLEQLSPGWCRVRTHYRYEGIAAWEDLKPQGAEDWLEQPKILVYTKNQCDVLSEPKVQGWVMQELTRGCLVVPAGEPEDGWQPVRLADGRKGYLPEKVMKPQPEAPVSREEGQLRQALVEAAMLYQGSHYRWGGKSPLGIDCSGLCSMAYLLCGIVIYRDAEIREGFPLHEIPRENMGPGDLLFFPGHVAMYLGQGRYCHSTARSGSNGFAINSLNPHDDDYREDLDKSLTQVASLF